MPMDANLIYPVASGLLGFLVAYLIFHRNFQVKSNQVVAQESAVRELEKKIHLVEAEHLKARNELEMNHHEKEKSLREKLNKEAYELGVASCKKDHQVEVSNLRSEYRELLTNQIKEAEDRTRTLAKLEFEAQAKAFSVSIRPYVKIEKDAGIIFDDHKSYTGYQYQLLVNGIPAFQPHIVIEKTEEIKQADKETIFQLVKMAESSARSAISTYLSGATGQMFTVGAEIIERTKA
ncbi:hypothetical protein E5198_17365 [Pseudomonas sp. A-1]|uniref:hypothetical protein n=1 Tax=Pseudomonas sp. A-1 TaxID=1821274 RepID=UPI0010A5C7C6|nr:hypothetical protein [Pseudomonas sp. A-1]THG77015.1 hypothetical protein E5198_17365 [Pseudomonas sp. A-1]